MDYTANPNEFDAEADGVARLHFQTAMNELWAAGNTLMDLDSAYYDALETLEEEVKSNG